MIKHDTCRIYKVLRDTFPDVVDFGLLPRTAIIEAERNAGSRAEVAEQNSTALPSIEPHRIRIESYVLK